jgi:hypothetical protein
MAQKILTIDWEDYALGDVNVVNNVWGTDGRSHTQTITIADDGDLSGGIVMQWDWGGVTDHVLAYPEVVVGYKPWDDPATTGTNALSTVLSDIRDFDIIHDLSISGSTANFNVAYDLWLTSAAMGDEYTITTELMIWAHKGGPIDEDAFVGQYTQKGTTFDIIVYDDFGDPSGGTNTDWRYIALVPRTDILDATIDVNAIFHALIERGLVSDKDFLTGYELGAEIYGSTGSLAIDHLSHVLDTFGADGKANVLKGTTGADRMHGLGGADTLIGRAGGDFLDGGRGSDILTGGGGKDTFFFESLVGKDRITDFQSGTDTIALSEAVFNGLGSADSFKSGKVFGADTHLLYNRARGELFYDADGSGTDDSAHLIAVLEDHAKLKYSDFEIV